MMKIISTLCVVLLLNACGPGGSSGDSTTDSSKPQITITPSTSTYVYDGTIPTQPTATISGSTNTTSIIITGNIGSDVGTYVLTYTATDSAGNKQIRQTATITITPKPITITANDVSKYQNTINNPRLSDDREIKLLSGDSLTGTLGSIGLSTNIVDTYDITSTLSNSNYDITFVGKDKFSIKSKPPIIAAKYLIDIESSTKTSPDKVKCKKNTESSKTDSFMIFNSNTIILLLLLIMLWVCISTDRKK